jgi:hypothetical protein
MQSGWPLARKQQWKEAGEMMQIDSDEAYRERVKENFEFSTWAGRTKEGDRSAMIRAFTLPTKLNGLEVESKEEVPPGPRQQRVTRYILSSREFIGRRIVTTVFECNSVDDAHETLIDIVMTYMAPKLPRCETKGLEVGDICFGSHGEVNLSVIFARFNILTEIQSATPGPTSVDDLARHLDSLILSRYRANPPA